MADVVASDLKSKRRAKLNGTNAAAADGSAPQVPQESSQKAKLDVSSESSSNNGGDVDVETSSSSSNSSSTDTEDSASYSESEEGEKQQRDARHLTKGSILVHLAKTFVPDPSEEATLEWVTSMIDRMVLMKSKVGGEYVKIDKVKQSSSSSAKNKEKKKQSSTKHTSPPSSSPSLKKLKHADSVRHRSSGRSKNKKGGDDDGDQTPHARSYRSSTKSGGGNSTAPIAGRKYTEQHERKSEVRKKRPDSDIVKPSSSFMIQPKKVSNGKRGRDGDRSSRHRRSSHRKVDDRRSAPRIGGGHRRKEYSYSYDEPSYSGDDISNESLERHRRHPRRSGDRWKRSGGVRRRDEPLEKLFGISEKVAGMTQVVKNLKERAQTAEEEDIFDGF